MNGKVFIGRAATESGRRPFIVNAFAMSTDGHAVAANGTPAFNGQVFFNPGSGTMGRLQRRMFSGS